LAEHTASRDEAKDTMAKATALRKKEAGIYAQFKSDSETNIAALDKAIPAIEKGMAGAFLQTEAASRVRTFVMEKAELPDASRDEVLSFLSGGSDQKYVPGAGEIVGILKTIHDEMSAAFVDATAVENAAIDNYEALMAAKKKEVATLQKQIETEMTRIGELSVRTAGAENDLEDTKEALAEDQKFKRELETSCDTKTGDWELIKGIRADELTALADTIKVLNDDDALDLFKATLPSASMSFMQIQVGSSALRAKALALVQQARASRKSTMTAHPQLDLLALALSGKKAGFEKVISMIDAMVANLHKEQQGDDDLRAYCESSLDKADDQRKVLENSIHDSEVAISEMEGAIAQLTDEIAALTAGVKALDKSVAEATELRKEENADFKKLISDDSAAKDLLKFAKNRLNKFYNPKLYKPPPKLELTGEERLTVNLGGTVTTAAPGGIANTGISASFLQTASDVAPPPPPETFGPYQKKTDTGNGVIAMIDLLIKDLDKEIQEADVNEKHSQQEYEALMSDSAAKRAADSKSITDKDSEKASTEESLQTENDAKADATGEHMNTMKEIASLHGECDWNLKYFEVRKQARADEIESLNNAKAVLNGASYSLIQQSRLRGRVSKHM